MPVKSIICTLVVISGCGEAPPAGRGSSITPQRSVSSSDVERMQITLSDAAPEALATKLSSAETAMAEMCAAERVLQRVAPEVVLSLALPRIAEGMPSEVIFNSSGTPEGDADGPPEWRTFYAFMRIWDHAAAQEPELAGELLAAHLSETSSRAEKQMLPGLLRRWWVASAENPVASVLRDSDLTTSHRFAAAYCLMKHRREEYFDELKRMTRQQPRTSLDEALWQCRLVRLLIEDRAVQNRRLKSGNRYGEPATPIDPELLVLAFELLQTMEQQKNGAGYHLASELGDYVGHHFRPDRRDPRYPDNVGRSNRFFADCSANALAWWADNRNSFEKSDRDRNPES